MIKSLFQTLTLSLLVLSFSDAALAQNTKFKSALDDALTIKTVSVLPILDNVGGIYSKPLSTELKNIVVKDRQWDLKEASDVGGITPETLEDSPSLVQRTLNKINADALLATRLTKGQAGVGVKMTLFLKSDGLPLAQEVLQGYQGFEVTDIQNQISDMFLRLKKKLPTAGIILSRTGQLTTINVGSSLGYRVGDELSVVQVIKVERHPRFRFVISSDKEVIGRLKISKIDDNLSFASIILERTPNIIEPQMKIFPVSFVAYNETPLDKKGQMTPGLNSREDGGVAFGDQPGEWTPESAPTFGKFGILFGLGSGQLSNTLAAGGSVTGTDSMAPSIHATGELWLSKKWYADMAIRQSVFSVSNGLSGSSPAKLNASTQSLSLSFGYNFLLNEEFFGPKIQLGGGYHQKRVSIDNSSPVALTSLDFGGFCFDIGASFPIAPDLPYTIGAKLNYFLMPSVSESPVSSGAGKPTMTNFSLFGEYKKTQRLNLKGELRYELSNASFSGGGGRVPAASSASLTQTTFAGGIEFLF